MKKHLLALPVLVSLFASCSGKKCSIAYNASYCKDHVVKIDDTLTLKPNEKSFANIDLMSGEHTVKVDAGKPVAFEVEDNAILNFAHDEFVVFPIKFSYGDQKPQEGELVNQSFGVANWVVIDSFVVKSQDLFGKIDITENLKRDGILKSANGNENTELVKTDSNQLVIKKTWDIGINDEIPRSVSESVSSSVKSATIYRKKVVEAKHFLLYSIATGSYIVKPLSSFPE